MLSIVGYGTLTRQCCPPTRQLKTCDMTSYHLNAMLMLLERLVSFPQDEVVVNLPDERFVLVNPQLREERFSDLGFERLPTQILHQPSF